MSKAKRIIDWNQRRGLLDKLSLSREISFTISEDLELLDWRSLATIMLAGVYMTVADSANEEKFEHLKIDLEAIVFNDDSKHDDFARWMATWFIKDDVTEADFIDKCADQKVFIEGGEAKMFRSFGIQDTGEIADFINDCDDAVMTANECKPIGKVDVHGKQEKPNGFEKIDPKERINKIIEEAKKVGAGC